MSSNKKAPRHTPETVTLARNYLAPCIEWWGRAAEDKAQPPAFSRLATSGVVTLMPGAALAMLAWGRTIPGWEDAPVVVSK